MKLSAVVIDDDEVVTFIHQTLLNKTEELEKVHVFGSGSKALAFLEDYSFAYEEKFFILLDINMPIMDGWEFLEQLTPSLTKDCAAIYILSSSIDRNDLSQAKKMPIVDGFLHKPFNLATARRICMQVQSKLQG